MSGKSNKPRFGKGVLDTLAQKGTANAVKPAVILTGKGSEPTGKDYSQRKGKKKMISQRMALHMVAIARQKGNKPLEQSFRNTYYCLNKVFTSEGRIYGDYCKNRFCTVCMAIRKAEKINNYLPVLQQWKDPHFVTLTIKAPTLRNLKTRVKGCMRAITQIIEKYRKQHQRGKGRPLIGIRSLECNFNPDEKTYNPHFHIIVPDRETGDILIREWLKKWTWRYAEHYCQKNYPITNLNKSLIEVIKYGSKIFTEPDVNKKAKKQKQATGAESEVKIYARGLYNIFDAMKGLRIFERFGFNLPKQTKEKTRSRVTTEFEEWIYSPKFRDWLHEESEQTLLGYTPEPEIVELLKNENIDVMRE